MQIFTSEINQPEGKINHIVHADWDDKGNLHFVEQDTGTVSYTHLTLPTTLRV